MNRSNILTEVHKYASQKLERKPFVPGKSPVPASGPSINPDDVTEIVDAALDFWYTDWKRCAEFRRRLCEYTGKKHCVLVNSGSSASLVASTALMSMTDKKYVVTTALGFPTTVYPIYQNGKIPIFVDVDPKTLSPNWDHVYNIWTSYRNHIAGFVFAHTLGFPFDETKVPLSDKEYKAPFFIADCCDSLGASLYYDGDPTHVGYFADVMTLSFFPAHHINCGEGGAVLTDDDDLAERMNKIVNWGRDCVCLPGQANVCGHRFDPEYFGYDELPSGWDHKYTFVHLGYNLKMTELQAAMGVSQMNFVDYFVDRRQFNFSYLYDRLYAIASEHLDFIDFDALPGEFSPFGFPIFVKRSAKFTAAELVEYLERNKISTRRIFGGNLTRQPAIRDLQYLKTDLSNTDYVMENGFWIGVHPALTEEHLDYVIEKVCDFMDERGL